MLTIRTEQNKQVVDVNKAVTIHVRTEAVVTVKPLTILFIPEVAEHPQKVIYVDKSITIQVWILTFILRTEVQPQRNHEQEAKYFLHFQNKLRNPHQLVVRVRKKVNYKWKTHEELNQD